MPDNNAVTRVPAIRIRKKNDFAVQPSGQYVLYWMIASRRLRYNFALDRAAEHCLALRKPLVILEALRLDYHWACERLHRFVLDGMASKVAACAARGITYLPYVEPASGAEKGLLAALAKDACVVVTDEFPCFFLPRMVATAAGQLRVLLESVDSNGLLPIYATDRVAHRAFDFRRYLQKELPAHLQNFPSADPLAKLKRFAAPEVAPGIFSRWPVARPEMLSGERDCLNALPIDHSVKVVGLRGGEDTGRRRLRLFLEEKLVHYSENRNDPEQFAASGVSPYLHFGYVSAHEIFVKLAKRENWALEKLSLRANGRRKGWWNVSAPAEDFLDQLVTWREIGYNFAAHREDYSRYESLPDWARGTLKKHTKDEREYVYNFKEFENAQTHDELWNAAQTQLTREGRIHNYLRMLWGKKILEWSRTPEEAAETMIHLNNKYALDGRDPNSYSGIFWVLGRYDRPWGPERPVFGTVRYMSSKNTARKFSVKKYIERYSREQNELFAASR